VESGERESVFESRLVVRRVGEMRTTDGRRRAFWFWFVTGACRLVGLYKRTRGDKEPSRFFSLRALFPLELFSGFWISLGFPSPGSKPKAQRFGIRLRFVSSDRQTRS
jgi:hypothetical protein